MAEQAEVKIVTVDAVQSLADLKEAIKKAKEGLDGMDIGSKNYQKQLAELIKMQALLRNAMNATTLEEEDQAKALDDMKKAADGTGESYNALVKKMADLTRAFRATGDAAKRVELGDQIREINDQLKQMDAMRGNFQRNVGDYFNQVTAPLKEVIKDLPSGLNLIKQPMDDVTKSLGLMGKQPILGILGLLAPLISEIAKGIKENDGALKSVNKAMEALDPLMQFFENILDKVVNLVVDLIGKASAFVQSNGIINQIIKGVMGVGNAILQFVIAPFKGIVEAIKVFKEQGVKGIGEAAKAFGREVKSGVSFKENFQTGQTVADTLISGMSSQASKKKAVEAGKQVGKSFADGMYEAAMRGLRRAEANEAIARAQKDFYDVLAQMLSDADEEWSEQFAAETAAMFQENLDALKAYTDEEAALHAKSVKDAEEAAKRKVAAMDAFASGTADLLGAIADAYESNGELTEKEEKRVKNLRIAAATINMLQGAVTAFATAQELGPIAGPIVGAINAAAVVATGIANIAKIKSTNVSRDSAPSSSGADTGAASVQAPSLPETVPTTTVVNGAKTETALNNAAKDRKVYLVYSEAEAMGEQVAVTESESSF